MFIENPNKKEAYSFRVKPELLDNIKNYAKATNQTVPELLNDMIEEKTKGLHLTNDYLKDTLSFNGVIGLPTLTEIYDNGKYKEFNLFSNDNKKVLYEIQKIPNNLDIWTDSEGYKSDKRGVNHEGISFILAPELITEPDYLENPDLLFCCLIPIYFKVSYNSIRQSTIAVTNISWDNAFKKINKAPNIELLDDFTRFTNVVKDLITRYINRLKNATEYPDGTYYTGGFTYSDRNQLLNDIYSKLIIELSEYSINVNVNVLSHFDGSIKRDNSIQKDILMSDNEFLLHSEIDKLKAELDKSNKEKEELKESLSKENEELKETINKIEENQKKLQYLIMGTTDKDELIRIRKYL